MSIELTAQLVAAMSPNDAALQGGRGLIKKGAFRALSKNEDGSLVWAECKGSAAQPYKLSFDLNTGGDRPTTRCSCPSRIFPCKHCVGLMLAFVENGTNFKVTAPPQDLLDKRQKLAAKNDGGDGAAKKAAAPRKVDKGAQLKKAQEQLDALDTLETFLVDIVAAGVGGLSKKNVKAVEEQAKRMNDAQLRGAYARLMRLWDLIARAGEKEEEGGDDDDDDDDDYDYLSERRRAATRLSDEERRARVAQIVTQLWVTVRKGKKALEGKLEEGDTKSEADAQAELLLGRVWQLPELKEAGYWVTERNLLELSHESSDDPLLEMVSAAGYLLDLDDGRIHVESTPLPYKALQFGGKLRASRAGVIAVREAALYPGEVVNRRVRWNERDPEAVRERPREAGDYAKVHALARPLEPVLKAYRDQLKNPLSPLDAVFLVRAAKYGRAGDAPLIDDGAGGRVLVRDPREAIYPTTRNFAQAAGAFGPGSVALRLWFDPTERAVFGQALALFAGETHLRLGL
jgi:hypothetical protein